MSTTTVMLVMVDAGPVRRWWAGPVVGMTRRRGVGRRPARLMYAGWDRRSAVRRKGPLTKHAPARCCICCERARARRLSP
jgi:hypothetical protein